MDPKSEIAYINTSHKAQCFAPINNMWCSYVSSIEFNGYIDMDMSDAVLITQPTALSDNKRRSVLMPTVAWQYVMQY